MTPKPEKQKEAEGNLNWHLQSPSSMTEMYPVDLRLDGEVSRMKQERLKRK